MKKLLALFLTAALLFSLAACGGGGGSTPAGSDHTPAGSDSTPAVSRQPEQGTNTPAPGSDSPSVSVMPDGVELPTDKYPFLAGLVLPDDAVVTSVNDEWYEDSGVVELIVKPMTAEKVDAYMEKLQAAGYTEAEVSGLVSPDGTFELGIMDTWVEIEGYINLTVFDTGFGASATEGLPEGWPDNEYTALVPVPDCGGKVLTSGEIGTLFSLELKWDMEQGLSYAQLLQDAGFGDDCVEKYEQYGYIDRTANGINVQLLDLFGVTSLSIMLVPDSDTQQDGDPIDLSGFLNTKTGRFYSRFADGRMYMEYEVEMEGQIISMISATDGSRTYSETKMDGVSMGISITDGEAMYTIDHTSGMIIKTALQADAQTIAGTVLQESDVDMGTLKTGTRDIDGKTYDTEEWILDGAASVFCFDGDELVYMIGVFDGMEMTMKIVEASDSVDDSLFEIPEDYTVMEM